METTTRTARFVPSHYYADDVDYTSRTRRRSSRTWDDGTARISRRQSR